MRRQDPADRYKKTSAFCLALARLSYQHHHHNHHFYFIITLIITFITTLTILLSARHVYEIGILALQVDESIVMKLMMSSKRNAGLYRENRWWPTIGSTTSLWHKWPKRWHVCLCVAIDRRLSALAIVVIAGGVVLLLFQYLALE
jgi:hypothetical protein